MSGMETWVLGVSPGTVAQFQEQNHFHPIMSSPGCFRLAYLGHSRRFRLLRVSSICFRSDATSFSREADLAQSNMPAKPCQQASKPLKPKVPSKTMCLINVKNPKKSHHAQCSMSYLFNCRIAIIGCFVNMIPTAEGPQGRLIRNPWVLRMGVPEIP
jgi:hypothetical protein